MRLIICDDSREDAEKARNIVMNSGIPGLTIQIYTADKLNSELKEDRLNCDIMILNIRLNTRENTGIELAKQLNRKLPDCELIYLSDVPKLTAEMYETNHCYNMPKSDMEQILPRALRKAYTMHIDKKHENIVKFVCDGHTVFLAAREISYVEKMGRLIVLHVGDKLYSSYMTLVNLQKVLGNSFARCHGSFIVNMDYVKVVEKDRVILDDDYEIPVGRTYQTTFHDRYLEYWTRYMQ
ncbi:MAG: LytR/AlgR family response regulator transcription factor [Wujia sp.]